MSKRETLSAVDAAWLHMDSPSNLAVIAGVILFDAPLDFERLQAIVMERLVTVKRFRQRVREPRFGVGMPVWETDEDFDVNAHVHRVQLPPPGTQAQLQDLVSELMSIPLDPDRPLWQWHYVEHYGKGSALITRLHHCIGDGMALVRVLLRMTDEEIRSSSEELVTYQPNHRARDTTPLIPAAQVFANGVRTYERIVHDSVETVVHPRRVIRAARVGAGGARALGKLVFIPPDHSSLYNGKCLVPKRAAWSKPIKLSQVKAVGKAAGATVNDILLACVTGALRRYSELSGEPADGLNIRAIVPVNLRSPKEPFNPERLGNKFGLVFLSLPVGIVDPTERLAVLKARMDAIKHSPEAVVAYGILNVIGVTPIPVEKVITGIFGLKGTAVMTNVRGPAEPIHLAGQPIRGVMFWVPTPAQLGLGVSIISYAGEISVGISTDESLVPEPELITAAFRQEFQAFQRRFIKPRRAAAPRQKKATVTPARG